jgi:Tfp pilus assembly protein PilV
MPFHLLKKHSQSGFTVLEALFASVILALGLFGSFQLSTASMAAHQSQRNLDLASGLAQDLAECWQVPSAYCISQFPSSQNSSALSTEAGIQFQRSWNTTVISTQGPDPMLLQNLKILVKWPSQDTSNSTSELSWQIRRASTPAWVGL